MALFGTVNKVILVGNLGKDPEVRTTQDGKKIVTFPLATSETWKDKQSGERKEKTEWHRVSIFNDGLAEIAQQHIKKGSKVFVSGELRTSKWGEAGAEKYSTDIVLQGYRAELTILDNKAESQSMPKNPTETNAKPSDKTVDAPGKDFDLDDDIPF